jgi:hypothetical protein
MEKELITDFGSNGNRGWVDGGSKVMVKMMIVMTAQTRLQVMMIMNKNPIPVFSDNVVNVMAIISLTNYINTNA